MGSMARRQNSSRTRSVSSRRAEGAFTCGLKIEGLTQNAPPSIARAYQNGVIRVDDYLVAVNGMPSGNMKPDPKWRPDRKPDPDVSEEVPTVLENPKDAAVTADDLEKAV